MVMLNKKVCFVIFLVKKLLIHSFSADLLKKYFDEFLHVLISRFGVKTGEKKCYETN